MIIIFLAALVPFVMVGCGNDTELKWKNELGSSVEDIKWVKSGETSNNPDQTWDGTLANTAATDYKKVEALTGEGYCLAGGSEQLIQYDDGNTLQSQKSLTEGSSESITINQVTAKK